MNAEEIKQREEAVVRFLQRLASMADIKLGPKPSEEELKRIKAIFNVVARVRCSIEEALGELERAEETLERRLDNRGAGPPNGPKPNASNLLMVIA